LSVSIISPEEADEARLAVDTSVESSSDDFCDL
jgi:hypothetical protein